MALLLLLILMTQFFPRENVTEREQSTSATRYYRNSLLSYSS
jgi:hypothetical protein